MHYEEPEENELDPADADVDHEIAAEIEAEANHDINAEEALISHLEENTFTCAECRNNFEIEDSCHYGPLLVCNDCHRMMTQQIDKDAK